MLMVRENDGFNVTGSIAAWSTRVFSFFASRALKLSLDLLAVGDDDLWIDNMKF
jgi:hypothetical protein